MIIRNVQKSGNVAGSAHPHSVSNYTLRECSVRYRPLLAAENISLARRSRRCMCKRRRANRTGRRKIQTLFKPGRKIRIIAIQDSNSQPISSNCQNWGEFAVYCREIRQKGYCFALPITASLLRRRQWVVGGVVPRSAKRRFGGIFPDIHCIPRGNSHRGLLKSFGHPG